jgi:YebC/PmpR family DNA-binding regulatory protein
MSGHSKWATIKRKKAATDAARGKAFSKYIMEITLAARAGADPVANPRLRTAIAAAKSVNMPASNIERAIQRGSGAAEGARIEEFQYEGYAPGGVAVLVEIATDNRNRTAGEVRNLFARHGGNLAEAGAVAYLFKPRGLLVASGQSASEDALIEAALDAGADDVVTGDEGFEIFTPPHLLEAVREKLAAKGIALQHAELTRIPSVQVPVDERDARAVLRLVDALEDREDVQRVYANFSMADELMAKLSH